MKKKLAGCSFIRNGVKFDYCFIEAIKSLQQCCDHVFVVDAGSDDGTVDELKKMEDEKTSIIYLTKSDWDNQHGKEKLSYFSNIAINAAQDAGYEYQLYIQGDELIHEKSYSEVRKAIETGAEGYMCRRINLWQSCYTQLSVSLDRMPCSVSVIRLCKTKYGCVDDAENVGVPFVDAYFEEGIRIYHMGFVRKREVMKAKITNMQVSVFGMSEPDAKLKECDTFNPKLWFYDEDLKPIDEPLPKLIQNWAKERYYED